MSKAEILKMVEIIHSKLDKLKESSEINELMNIASQLHADIQQDIWNDDKE